MGIQIFQIDAKRTLELECFFQRRTYADLMVGAPNKRVDDFAISQANQIAKKIMDESPIYVALPQPYEPGRLPPFLCIGMFTSHFGDVPGEVAISSLNVIWFEDSPCQSLLHDGATLLREIEWDRLGAPRNLADD